jgi:hypothetical protein
MGIYQIITDSDFERLLDSLPGDSEAALIKLDSLLREKANSPTTWREYMAIVRAFISQHDLKLPLPSFNSSQTLMQNNVDEFCERMDGHKAKILFKDNINKKSGLLPFSVLTDNDRDDIYTHINFIKKIIEKSNLADSKKEQLYVLLANLHKEVELSQTRIDRVFNCIYAICTNIDELSEKTKIADSMRAVWETLMNRSKLGKVKFQLKASKVEVSGALEVQQ